MTNQDPNSFDKEIEDAEQANPQANVDKGTEQTATGKTEEDANLPDYRVKFVESAKEAQRLFKEKADLEAEVNRLKQGTRPLPDATDDLVPGFSEMTPSEQDNLVAYTNAVTKRVLDGVQANPAIAYAQQSYNENKFNNALDLVLAEFPDLSGSKSEFKTLYFNPQNVPDNISDILRDMAKVYLFDRAKSIGADEAMQTQDRVQLEDTTGGERGATARRTLADWNEIAKNPAKFATMAKEYQADLDSGLLTE